MKFTKSLAIFLAILMVLYIVPMSVFAEIREIAAPKGNDETTSESLTDTGRALTVLGEIVDKRTSTTKTFRMSDKSYVTVQYGETVHFKTENGYEDYDNTLKYTEAANDSDISGYSAVSSDLNVKLAEKTSDRSLVTIRNNKNDRFIAMNPISESDNSIGIIKKSDKNKSFKGSIEDYADLPNYSSSIIYPDVFDGYDLQYSIVGGKIKESIILDHKSFDYNFSFSLDLSGLIPAIDEDGNVLIKDAGSNEIIYIIPRGYMYDANNNCSDKVFYSLEKISDGSYYLIVSADAEWINENGREFPIIVDPTIDSYSSYNTCTVKETYISESNPSANYNTDDKLLVGQSSGTSSEYITLIGIKQDTTSSLPDIPETSVITSAELHVKTYESKCVNASNLKIGAYLADQPQNTFIWDLNSLTWNNTIGNGDLVISDTLLDYQTTEFDDTNSDGFYFDVTKAVKRWYETRTGKYCIALRAINAASNTYAALYNSHSYCGYLYPYFTISYRDNKGIEDQWSYTSHDVGNAGTVSICDYTGSMVYLHNDVSTIGGILNVSVDHVFNSYLANVPFTEDQNNVYAPITVDFSSMRLGHGFKLSLQETLTRKRKIIYDQEEQEFVFEPYYILSDGDGTERCFVYDHDAGSTIEPTCTVENFYDEDDPTLTLSAAISTNGGLLYATITDGYGNSKYFDSSRCLKEITDTKGNKKTITYNNGKIVSLSETQVGQTEKTVYNFVYINNILKKICQVGENNAQIDRVQYYYSSSLNGNILSDSALNALGSNASLYLRKIDHINGTAVTIDYEADGYISKITDVGRSSSAIPYSIEYTYGTNASFKRVSAVVEKSGTNIGQQFKIEYGNKETEYVLPGEDHIYDTVDDIRTTYVFDNAGNIVTAYSTDHSGQTIYGVSNAGYDKKDKLVSAISSGVQAQNLLSDSSFEQYGSFAQNQYWTTDSVNGTTYTIGSTAYIGQKGCDISTTSGNGSVSQTVLLSETGKYTVSAYIKTAQIIGAGAYIKIKQGTTVVAKSIKDAPTDWERISASFEVALSGNYTVELGLTNSTGTVSFDAVQLEKNNAPSEYNAINNSGFENNTLWTYSGNNIALSGTNKIGGSYSLLVTGDPSSAAYAYQDIPISSGVSQAYLLSGWAKANSVTSATKKFGLYAEIWYDANGTDKEEQGIEFNPFAEGWQYTSISIVPDPEKTTVYNIRIYCRYDYNGNSAYFDNISLIKENTPTVYERDEDTGYITKITSDGQTSEITYDGVDVASVKNADGQEETYDHNSDHEVTSETLIRNTSGENNVPNKNTYYSYDSFGNVTSVLTQSSNQELQSRYNYSSDGKFMTWSRDENHIRTNYAYDSLTGSVTSITMHPDESNSSKDIITRTEYSSTTDLPVKTYIDSDKDGIADSSERQINYTYDDNLLLTSISTGSTIYNIEYNAFRNISAVRIYGRSAALASYAYEANNGNLSSVTYANGFTIQNVYDNLDRISEIKYNNIIKYRYTYDGSGNLYSAEDVAEGITSYYEYNMDGSISSVKETETSSGNVYLISRNTYDSLNRVSGISYYTVGSDTKTYSFDYDEDTGNLVSVILPDGNILLYTYDELDRLTSKRIKTPNQTEDQFISKEEYTYATASDDYPINLIASIKYNESTSDMQSYTYDDMGNLLTVSVGGTLELSYEYDDALQLVRENNVYADATYLYEYDLYGNITAKKTYAYTAPGTAVSGTYTTITYTYGNAYWGDLLTNYNGTTITYDASGNPANWHNLAEMLWQGRQLYDLHFSDASEISFKYNADGIRAEKKLYDTNGLPTQTVEFTLDGTKIIHELHDYVIGTDYIIDYIYGGGELPIGFSINGNSYYYRKNLQGDVISIVNASGAVVAEYTYDAWGKVLSITGTSASTIGAINPIRYRSYYYDSETGFYYLQSRYYDPQVGRFINADDILDFNNSLLGLNLFTYCSNAPINMVDSYGEKPQSWYSTIDEAAIDCAYYINAKSIKENCVYISYIYEIPIKIRCRSVFMTNNITSVTKHIILNSILKLERGKYTITVEYESLRYKYSYIEPVKAKDMICVDSVPSSWYDIKNKVAILYTRGAYNNGLGESIDFKEKNDANRFNLIFFIATPSGILRKYDPRTRKTYIRSRSLPFDSSYLGRR